MADKITNFEDYKKRGNGEDIDIEIEDPYDFFNEQEREEYYKERQKEKAENRQRSHDAGKEQLEGMSRKADEEKDFYDDCDDNEDIDEEDIDEEYEDYEEDYEEEEEKSGFPIELFVRISSIISGILILSCIAIVAKVKIFDKYFAPDPDEETVVVSAIPAGFTEKNDTVTVTAENLNLRSTPSSESKDTIVTAVSKGTQLKRVAVSGDGSWALVEYEGNQLYASMKYLSE